MNFTCACPKCAHCDPNQKATIEYLKTKIQQLEEDNNELQSAINLRDSIIKMAENTMNQIEAIL